MEQTVDAEKVLQIWRKTFWMGEQSKGQPKTRVDMLQVITSYYHNYNMIFRIDEPNSSLCGNNIKVGLEEPKEHTGQ